ncbi:MAG: GIY-YIG nuclease family protein, partial [Patescibacteria group bacterium]
MYQVYAIFNQKHSKVYIGQTEDLDNRIKLHNEEVFCGSYTSRYNGKWEIVYTEGYETRQEALKREKQLKSYQGRQFIKNIIIPRWRNGSAGNC